MNVAFDCPSCGCPTRLLPLDQACDWRCSECDHRLTIGPVAPELPACAICGNTELFKKKAFPHALGMTILVAACVASVFTYALYDKWTTWAILIGSALIDVVLYHVVGDAVVCYRCQAQYFGFQPSARHWPYELIIGERYRQERLRRQELKQ